MMTSSASSTPDLHGRKILIVDDDRLNLRILTGILRPDGYTLAEADSGERALEVYAEFRPDLVLLDVVLPGINGFETCRILHQTYGVETSPVIFITAKSESDDVVEGLAAGGIDYLPKPFRPKEALARIRTHMHNRLLVEQQRLLVEQLNKADAAKNKFLGMAAHDLRNPLASIRGLAEFMLEGTVGTLSADQIDLIKTIHVASQQMLQLVNELLDVAVIESGELKIVLEPSNLDDLINKAVYLANIEAEKKKTHISFNPRSPALIVKIDPAKMKQVVENLLSNAVKYSPPGSQIAIDLVADDNGCGFAVRDQGPGIPDDERDKLFKDFGRLSARPTGGEKSVGLGLAICRKIVEAHGGTITAENLPNPARGCEFRVILSAT
ncbi:MAG TPA: hybrid sensor histidine kinase/response regulator [Opitutaceae bacterium]|nr:hybrid sensor histidine kinase/response regulator [Opitutaceae bacterium]